MILITGDIHSKISGSYEQKVSGSEIKSAKNYLEILKKYGLSSTLFINGICFKEEPENIKKILRYDVELGGHTYNNFGRMPPIKSFVYRKLFGCVYGSKSYQKKDILKTKSAFEKWGLKMKSWRTHAFSSNQVTFSLLNKMGVQFVSDLLGEIKPYKNKGLLHLPVNIPVDQNTISYGNLNPKNRDPFASCVKGRITPEEWLGIVQKRIEYNEKKQIPSVLLVHPATMATLDQFKTFEELARFLSKYKSLKISEFKIEYEDNSLNN